MAFLSMHFVDSSAICVTCDRRFKLA